MKLRSAIKRHDDIIASCPIEGPCVGVQTTQGKIVTYSCDYYVDTREEGEKLLVRCRYQGPECRS